jgi:hypothetical protein
MRMEKRDVDVRKGKMYCYLPTWEGLGAYVGACGKPRRLGSWHETKVSKHI